jgi:hypothetical protein
LAFDLDLGAAVFANEDLVPFFDGEFDELAIVITLAGAEGNDFAFLGLFFGGIGNDDAALFDFRLFERLDENAIREGSYV